MTNLPPDPEAAEIAELRSEDDGMPVHPEKVKHPRRYAKTHKEREKAAAAGYPTDPVRRVLADAEHNLDQIAGELTAPRNRRLVAVAGAIGFGLAILLIERIYHRPRRRRYFAYRW